MDKMIDVNSIQSATLLSCEEARKYREMIPPVEEIWWLRSAGGDDIIAACVFGEHGDVYDIGNYVDEEFGVRPALRISNPESLNLGEKFKFGGQTFTYLGEGLALCDNIVGNCAFRKYYEAPNANDYGASDIKKYVENWFEKVKEWKLIGSLADIINTSAQKEGNTITISPELEKKIVAFCDDELNYHINDSGCAEKYRSEIEAQLELLRLLGHEDIASQYEKEFMELDEEMDR